MGVDPRLACHTVASIFVASGAAESLKAIW
jgi:hypothetical protein